MSVLSRRGIQVESILVAALAGALVLGCHDEGVDARECPHYWGDFGGVHGGTPDSLVVPGLLTDLPEYNDCQRFIVKTMKGLVFDSIQAIFVRDSIQHVFSSLGSRAGKEEVGEVFSRGAYDPLGIGKDFNCIVLQWKNPADPSTYEAWMVRVGRQEYLCRPSKVDSLTIVPGNSKQLRVRAVRTYSDSSGRDSVPPVARWDWDDTASVQYFGLPCPTGWCEFYGHSEFHSSPTYVAPAGATVRARRVLQQKGWSDYQILADANPGFPPQVSPEKVMGVVFPAPSLDGRRIHDYIAANDSGGWMDAANVALNPKSSGYEAKFNYLANATPPLMDLRTNAIQMCFMSFFSPRTHCAGPVPIATCLARGFWDSNHKGLWFVRTRTAGKPDMFNCVQYFEAPPGIQPPGVVRWRWTLRDDSNWIPCPGGCCQTRK